MFEHMIMVIMRSGLLRRNRKDYGGCRDHPPGGVEGLEGARLRRIQHRRRQPRRAARRRPSQPHSLFFLCRRRRLVVLLLLLPQGRPERGASGTPRPAAPRCDRVLAGGSRAQERQQRTGQGLPQVGGEGGESPGGGLSGLE